MQGFPEVEALLVVPAGLLAHILGDLRVPGGLLLGHPLWVV